MFLIDVVHVKPLEGRKLELTFKDGLRAVVDMDQVIERLEGVFAPLTRRPGNRHGRLAERRRRVSRCAVLLCLGQTDYRER